MNRDFFLSPEGGEGGCEEDIPARRACRVCQRFSVLGRKRVLSMAVIGFQTICIIGNFFQSRLPRNLRYRCRWFWKLVTVNMVFCRRLGMNRVKNLGKLSTALAELVDNIYIK